MKKPIIKFLDKTFWIYILIGVIYTVLGAGLMFLLYNKFNCSYWISSLANHIFGDIVSYLANRRFTFRNSDAYSKTLPRYLINVILCYLIAYCIAKPLTIRILSNASPTLQGNIAMLVGMGLHIILNYIGQRYFVFRSLKASKSPDESVK